MEIPATLRHRYYILRHGQSEANREELIVSDPGRGVPEFGLTAEGRVQVARTVRTARRAGALGSSLRFHSSDFRRARESAEIAAAELEHTGGVQLEPGLRERFFGSWDGTSTGNYPRVWAEDPGCSHPADWRVEPVEAVLERALEVILRIEGEGEPSEVVLVTHGDVAQILLAAFGGMGPRRHREVPHLGTGELRALTRA